jgi:hypothetical protein
MSSSLPNPKTGRRWTWGLWLGLPALAGLLAVIIAPSIILGGIVAEAARHGFRLEGCAIDLAPTRIRLRDCSFASLGPPNVAAPVPGVDLAGRASEIEIRLAGFRPARAIVRGVAIEAWGRPTLADTLQVETPAAASLPIEVDAGTLLWRRERTSEAHLEVSAITYSSDTRRLDATWEWRGRARGRLQLAPDALEVTLGDAAPQARLVVRVQNAEQRAELSLELRAFPLASLESGELPLTDTLRAIAVDGRVFAVVPLGLTTQLPSGDVHLTLRGLLFPVPRELDGLVHDSPPRISGKFSSSRTFDRATFRDLGFLTGQLQMSGGAELTLDAERPGFHFQAHMSGPLSCRAIAEAAVTARAGSALGKLAGRWARQALNGNVQIVAALSGDSWELPRARVLTSTSVGCGLVPLPIDASTAVDILSSLPEDVLKQLPRIDQLPALPRLPEAARIPQSWRLPPAVPPKLPATPRN